MRSVRIPTKFLSLALLVTLAACTTPADQAEQAPAVDLAAEGAAVEAVSMQWLEAVQARDVDAATSLFAADAVFFDEDEGSIEGIEAIRADIASSWAENPDFTVSWSTDAVQVSAAGDMAWERGSWTFDPDGAGEAGDMNGEYVTIYEKVDGTWTVVSDIGVTHAITLP
jgi:uncharacterized protein (TIGR02246 family)